MNTILQTMKRHLTTHYKNVFYVTCIWLYYCNHTYFSCLSLCKITCILQYPFRNVCTCVSFVLKRKADVLSASSHHPVGSSSHQRGASWTQAEGKHEGRGCVYSVLCVFVRFGVCVCSCVCLQKLFSSQCWEKLQAGLPVLQQETKWRSIGGLEQCCESQHHPG